MATLKHLSSKNADYGAAEQYLTFEHDEFTGRPILDEQGRLVPRQDYRISSLNCGGEDFAVACMRANLRYGKNQRREDVKSHHYILSFDPRDGPDHGLTMDRAQALGERFCAEQFPGHQALVCTHPDGHNHSGNIHVHIVINSLRVAEVERKPYMDRASDTRTGDKHRCTAAAMRYFRSEVMEMCHREGLYQIDLLNGSKNKVTEREYWAKRKGQAKLDKENAALLAEGITPRQTKFKTDKDHLRQTIRQALTTAASFDEFSALLLREGVTVKESRGRLSYLTPDRTKPITARKLGTDFDKAAVLAVFQQNAARAVQRAEYHPQISGGIQRTTPAQITPNPDSPQRLVDIAAKRAEGKGIGYERWAKTFNLKQMAKTMNFLSGHGFTNPEDVDAALEAAISGQHTAGEKLKELESRITANKELMHQIGVYRRTKPAHDGLKTAKKPERYREAFHADLTLYEAAVRYFRERGLKKLPATSRLQAENEALISEKNGLYTEYREQKARAAELQKVKSNLAAMLRQERTKEVRRDWER